MDNPKRYLKLKNIIDSLNYNEIILLNEMIQKEINIIKNLKKNG